MGKPLVRIVSAEISREGCYLITQRPAHAQLPHLWEFPGGRVRELEDDSAALERALVQRLGCGCTIGDKLLEVCHEYEHYDLTMAVYRVEPKEEPVAASVAALAWVHPDELVDYPFPGADQRTVDLLLSDEDEE